MTSEQGPVSTEAEVLRPEARPLPYTELDEQQQVALERVVGLLTAAGTTAAQITPSPALDRVARATRTTPAQTGPYLEPNRCSRNILLSGERGTGKTTLMLSLARVLSTGPDAPLDKSLPPGVADQARALNRRLVWLETLDMEPLASEVNLLGAVLARIEDAVGARFPGLDKAPETVPLLHPGNSFHDVSREMARLQTSVALSFGGNLGDRAGSLDPDTFAVESRRAERERLGLDRRFADVLAGLSAALASTVELTAPVFVLPVDDVDLNVGDSVPLLRLLRASSSPHLIVVLAADVALLSTILRLKYQGELARISQPVALNDADQGVAADLAVNALRKHLPPAQRVVLGLVELKRALALRPIGITADSLGQKLGRVDLPADSAVLQVAERFGLALDDAAGQPVVTAPCWSAGTEDPAHLATRLAPYSWPQVLRQPMRRLVDLYLDGMMRAEEQRQHGPLTHDVTDTPLTQLAQTRSQVWRDSVRGREVGIDVSGRLGTPAEEQWGQVFVVQRPWHGWRASAGFVPLGTVEAAVLVGCLDLLGDRWVDSSYDGRPPEAVLEAIRATRWPADASSRERVINWPWVRHSTFWGYERALAWLAEADKAWANQPDAAFGSWVAVMTAQLFDAPVQGQPFDQPTRPLARDWTSLAQRLADLGATPLAATPLAEAWLDAVGLLCTPEMGRTQFTGTPPLLPSERAERMQALRAQRARDLPERLRTLADPPPADPPPADPPPADPPPADPPPADPPPADPPPETETQAASSSTRRRHRPSGSQAQGDP